MQQLQGDQMSSDGWICLHRKITEWEWYDDANTFRLFVHCLLVANHEDKKWRGTVIRRGQFISSRAKLSTVLKVSEQQIRTALSKLESTNDITIKGTSQHTVFTVNNYDKYQSINQQSNQLSTSESTNDQPTNNQRVTTNNNENNNNNKDSPSLAVIEQPIKIKRPNGNQDLKILFQEIADIYNEKLGSVLPCVQTLSPKRQKLLKARCEMRIGEHQLNTTAFWERYFDFVSKSDFLTGKSKSGWTADFDWLITETNFIRVIEGTYNNQRGGNA